MLLKTKTFFLIMRFFYPVLFLLLVCRLVNAQSRIENQAQFQVHIERAKEKISVDGKLEELSWQHAEVATDFWDKWPVSGRKAKTRTEIRLSYDDQFLYIGAVCFDSTPNYIVQNLKRDVGYWDSDGIAVVFDPANRATNGYFFGLTPAGAQTEGLVSNDPQNDDFTWDNRWYGEVSHQANGWTAEFAIPFQIIRFDAAKQEWGINFIRNDASNGIWHTWTRMPLQIEGTDLGFLGKLFWDAPPPKAKGNYNVSPFGTAALSRDFEAGEAYKAKPNAGLDAKIGIGSSLNLDVTVNPDFSQIEIDEQVVNLTRFDVQLPEKRTFFLENADIFSNFGIPPIRPFFSRKIGLDEAGRQIPIIAGLRLTGNLNAQTRIGVLDMQTAAKNGNPAQNFSAIALHRRLFGRTSVSGYVLNRQNTGKDEQRKNTAGSNAGAEFLFISNDGKWNYWATTHAGFKPGYTGKNLWGNTGGQYVSDRFNILVDVLRMGENYNADMGFEARIQNYDAQYDTTIRIGYNFIFSESALRFFPANPGRSKLNLMELGFTNFTVLNPSGSLNEQFNNLNYSWNYKNTAQIRTWVEATTARVPVHFKFDEETNEKCPALPDSIYRFAVAGLAFNTDNRRKLLLETEASAGGFYNGRQIGASIGFRYRAQPWGNFALKFQYNLLDFPTPYCDVVLFNITPRIELFFNRNLNWTTFIQYNTQADNFNLNSRLQWRFRPMSDLFLVYTDNYAVQIWGAKNRAFVVKLNYWL